MLDSIKAPFGKFDYIEDNGQLKFYELALKIPDTLLTTLK